MDSTLSSFLSSRCSDANFDCHLAEAASQEAAARPVPPTPPLPLFLSVSFSLQPGVTGCLECHVRQSPHIAHLSAQWTLESFP